MKASEIHRFTLIFLLVPAIFFALLIPSASGEVSFQREDNRLKITVDGRLFAWYVWDDPATTRPYFKEIHAAGGEVQVTRNHPPGQGDFDDHPTYHPGLWWGFGDVGGNDYWRMKARIIGGEFLGEPIGGEDRGFFAVRNRLLKNGSDETFCEQICRYTILRRPQGILIFCETVLRRDSGDFWLGDQEEMGLALRVATPIAVASNKGGRILNGNGSVNLEEIRTKQSDWCDYSGPIAGRHGGMLVMNDPDNFRRPWWHAVDTGLLIANPLGESELNGRGKQRENVLVRAGEPFRLRYGVLVHLEDHAASFDPAKAYGDFLEILPTFKSGAARYDVPQSGLPRVPDGFHPSIFAGEPLVYKPTSMSFDTRGRLFLGQGPQYPEHQVDSPTDSVLLMIDSDRDGVADETKVFAKGFNSIQGLAWKGDDLYVANAPDLTLVRDLDGDDEADEYMRIYTDLGNREHALHGLNFAPDGKLYMSKGNSKGRNQPEKYGYAAPRAFRELWDVRHPPGAPDVYPPQVFTKDTYRKNYQDWRDDWGREGGVLRCDPMGENLEIVSRGLRNPWDITLDDGFNWLGTDNDQTQGDRLFMPFFGAHFGWGHRYSSHWSGEGNLPTVPVSGPMFPGSGTGIIYYAHPHFPPHYRNVFFINDWLNGTHVYRPGWEGALMQPEDGILESFARRGGDKLLYRPTDLEFAPDGSLYICGWGGDYHYETEAEGSWIFRITHGARNVDWTPHEKRVRPHSEWTMSELLADLGPESIPVWRVNAQDELVRRGAGVKEPLIAALRSGQLSTGQETWTAWALGRMKEKDPAIDAFFESFASGEEPLSLNLRLQALRILGHRARNLLLTDGSMSREVGAGIHHSHPRIRFETIQAIHQARDGAFAPELVDRLGKEADRLVFYAGWRTLRDLLAVSQRKDLLNDPRPRVRLAALLSLQEDFAVSLNEVLDLAESDPDEEVQSWALTFAMNPLPPEKMPDTTARVELEQSITPEVLIERARAAVDRPALRRLYLKMISRTSFTHRDDGLKKVQSFYESLDSDEDRAMVLPALCLSIDVRELFWDAFGGSEPLRRAAVEGWHQMQDLAVPKLDSDEDELRAELAEVEKKAQSSGDPGDSATWLLSKLLEVGPSDKRVAAVVEILAEIALPPGWRPPPRTEALLAGILNQYPERLIRSNVLVFLSRIEPEQFSDLEPIEEAIRRLCSQPNPRLYTLLVNLIRKLKFTIEAPLPPQATSAGVLAVLGSANPERGRDLFFNSESGFGCAICHRVAGKGREFAPDLSGVGLRLSAEDTIRAILEPSASITEGYALHILETADGRTNLGAVIQESDALVKLVDAEGRLITLEKGQITKRQKLEQSVMPAAYAVFGNEQLADLTSWLLTLRDGESAVRAN